MPLFKKNRDPPVDTSYAGSPNDPNYAVASQYTPESNTYAGGAPNTRPSGVGTTLSQGNNTTDYYDSPQTAQPTTYDQSTAGYNTQPGMTTNQPVRNNVGGSLSSEPDYGTRDHMGTGVGTGTGTGMGTGMGTTTGPTTGATTDAATSATTSGLTGQHHAPYTGTQNVHNTAPTGTTGTNLSDMSPKDARKLEMKGKAQQLAGIVLSSQSMRAKGSANEQQAAAVRHHHVNTAEAEAHEAQARLARERAKQNSYH